MSLAPNRLTAWIIDELLKSDSTEVELMHALTDRVNGDPDQEEILGLIRGGKVAEYLSEMLRIGWISLKNGELYHAHPTARQAGTITLFIEIILTKLPEGGRQVIYRSHLGPLEGYNEAFSALSIIEPVSLLINLYWNIDGVPRLPSEKLRDQVIRGGLQNAVNQMIEINDNLRTVVGKHFPLKLNW